MLTPEQLKEIRESFNVEGDSQKRAAVAVMYFDALLAHIDELHVEIARHCDMIVNLGNKKAELKYDNAQLKEQLEATVKCIKKADKNCNHWNCAVKEWNNATCKHFLQVGEGEKK